MEIQGTLESLLLEILTPERVPLLVYWLEIYKMMAKDQHANSYPTLIQKMAEIL